MPFAFFFIFRPPPAVWVSYRLDVCCLYRSNPIPGPVLSNMEASTYLVAMDQSRTRGAVKHEALDRANPVTEQSQRRRRTVPSAGELPHTGTDGAPSPKTTRSSAGSSVALFTPSQGRHSGSLLPSWTSRRLVVQDLDRLLGSPCFISWPSSSLLYLPPYSTRSLLARQNGHPLASRRRGGPL